MNDKRFTFRSRDNLNELKIPAIMGIINVTPDSFYKASRYVVADDIVRKVEEMVSEGAKILDFGAVSTRPGSIPPTLDEELQRLIPILKIVRSKFPELLISIDTYRKEVLDASLEVGIDLVNDISGGRMDEGFLELVSGAKIPYILMHMIGTPLTMAKNHRNENLILDMLHFFSERIELCKSVGIKDIIIDPGIGFGKKISQNFEIIRKLSVFQIFDFPVLIGLSRESFLYKTLNQTPEETLNATTAMHMMALQNGATILRVHDVKEAVECSKIWGKYVY